MSVALCPVGYFTDMHKCGILQMMAKDYIEDCSTLKPVSDSQASARKNIDGV